MLTYIGVCAQDFHKVPNANIDINLRAVYRHRLWKTRDKMAAARTVSRSRWSDDDDLLAMSEGDLWLTREPTVPLSWSLPTSLTGSSGDHSGIGNLIGGR